MKNNDTVLKEIIVPGYEKILEIKNDKVGLHGIIAIHSTTLGPALGGIRVHPYPTFDQALNDVLRLSKGMTLKAAVAETGSGGGKGVIILDRTRKSTELLSAYAHGIQSLQGKYYGAEDMGITPVDLEVMHRITPYVVGLNQAGCSGDPSIFTARGAYRGIQAVCQEIWGNPSVRGKKIAIQGLGAVGMKLIQHLFWNGAELIVSDTNRTLVEYAVMQWGAAALPADQIYQADCDIFSPCAMGGIINDKTISQFKCRAIAGSANNQLLTEEDGEKLIKKGILYAPDFVINAGGLLNVCAELKGEKYNPGYVREKVDHLYELLLTIFDESKKKHKGPHQVAIEIAERRLKEHKP